MAKLRNRKSARTLREEAGISREALARQADVSTSTIVRLESGHVPGALALARIAKVLGVTIEDLLPKAEDAA